MRWLSRTVWQYAVLLIVLLATAAAAAWSTVSYLFDNIPEVAYGHELRIVGFSIWALTMGFMLIAGAFGLWAIRFAGEAESRRRISDIVDRMGYLNDGLAAMDSRGRVTAANPAFRTLLGEGREYRALPLQEAFDFLTPADIARLLDAGGPQEILKDTFRPGGRQTLRFRSQTAGETLLLLVSDITTGRLNDLRRQNLARLELIGRIARGVTNDFNNILTVVSGHASLLSRLPPGGPEFGASIAKIGTEANRGAALAGHLLDFSRLTVVGTPTDQVAEHVRKAGELVRLAAPSDWKVETDTEEGLPRVPLSGVQVEQAILNLALESMDAVGRPGVVRLSAARPAPGDPLTAGARDFAVALVVAVSTPGRSPESRAARVGIGEEAGVIQSVVRSLVEEAGGLLDCFAGSDGSRICRLLLPWGNPAALSGEDGGLSEELRLYLSHWRVLLARPAQTHDYVEEKLTESGVTVERVDDAISALGRIENGEPLQAIVIEKELLGSEARGLLRAILKLRPTTGIVVLCDDPDREPEDLAKDVMFLPKRTDPADIIGRMVEARGLAARRQAR